jgi:hypothetical protein
MAKHKTSSTGPTARSKDLLVEEVAGELLIYDVASDRAHCLNPTAAAIWKHCDGSRSTPELASHLFPSLSSREGEQLVTLGIERLRWRRLLDEAGHVQAMDLSKRQLVKRIAMVATAAGILAPLVSSIVAPTPANALSCTPVGGLCVSSPQCCPPSACAFGRCI